MSDLPIGVVIGMLIIAGLVGYGIKDVQRMNKTAFINELHDNLGLYDSSVCKQCHKDQGKKR